MADRRRRRLSEDDSGDESVDAGNISPEKGPKSECESETEHPSEPALSEYDSTADESRDVEETEEESETESEDESDTAEEESGGEEGSVVAEEERQSGDGEEQPDKNLDDDEDKKNPAYIPRKGAFYEHDMRLDPNEELPEDPREEKRGKGKLWKDDSKWAHDRYTFDSQAPKSREELIALYGYDITLDDKPPDNPPKMISRPRGNRDHRAQFQDFLPDDGDRRKSYGSNRDRYDNDNTDIPARRSQSDSAQDGGFQAGPQRGGRGRGTRGTPRRYSDMKDEISPRNRATQGNRDGGFRDGGNRGFGNRDNYANRDNRDNYANRDNKDNYANRENKDNFANRDNRDNYANRDSNVNRGGRDNYANRNNFGNRDNDTNKDNDNFRNRDNAAPRDRNSFGNRDNYPNRDTNRNRTFSGGNDDNSGNTNRDNFNNRGDRNYDNKGNRENFRGNTRGNFRGDNRQSNNRRYDNSDNSESRSDRNDNHNRDSAPPHRGGFRGARTGSNFSDNKPKGSDARDARDSQDARDFPSLTKDTFSDRGHKSDTISPDSTSNRYKNVVGDRNTTKAYEKPSPKSYYTLSPVIDDEKLLNDNLEYDEEYSPVPDKMADFSVNVSGSGSRKSYSKDRGGRSHITTRTQDQIVNTVQTDSMRMEDKKDIPQQTVPSSKHQPSLPPRLQQQQLQQQERKKQQQQQQSEKLQQQDSAGRSNKRYSSQRQRPTVDATGYQDTQNSQPQSSPNVSTVQQPYPTNFSAQKPVNSQQSMVLRPVNPSQGVVRPINTSPGVGQTRPVVTVQSPTTMMMPRGPPPHNMMPYNAGPAHRGPPPQTHGPPMPVPGGPLQAPPPAIYPQGAPLPVSVVMPQQQFVPTLVYAAPPPAYQMPMPQFTGPPQVLSVPPIAGPLQQAPVAVVSQAQTPVSQPQGALPGETVKGGTTYYPTGSTSDPKSSGTTYYSPEIQMQAKANRVQVRRPKIAIPIVHPESVKTEEGEGDPESQFTETVDEEAAERLGDEGLESEDPLNISSHEDDHELDQSFDNETATNNEEVVHEISQECEKISQESEETSHPNEDMSENNTKTDLTEDLSEVLENVKITDNPADEIITEQTDITNVQESVNESESSEVSATEESITDSNVVFKTEIMAPTLSVQTSVPHKVDVVSENDVTKAPEKNDSLNVSDLDMQFEVSKGDESIDREQNEADITEGTEEDNKTVDDAKVEVDQTKAETADDTKVEVDQTKVENVDNEQVGEDEAKATNEEVEESEDFQDAVDEVDSVKEESD